MIRDAVISASNNVSRHKSEIDALNVFPVPDGDTGTNMSMTLRSAAREASVFSDDIDISEASERIASALLRGARGNSGVILSLIFRGMSKNFKKKTDADGKGLAAAFVGGKESAYKAVMKPTEGTILTVIRIASEYAVRASKKNNDFLFVMEEAYKGSKKALAETPDILPVLKSAGVVDAGGQGLVYVFEGFLSVLKDGVIIGDTSSPQSEDAPQTHLVAAGEALSDIKYTYCTEFLIDKDKKKNNNPLQLKSYLESVGDCVVVVDDDDIIKVHCHSNEPGNVLQNALGYGPLISIKIENMKEQHRHASWGAVAGEKTNEGKARDKTRIEAKTAEKIEPAKAEKPFGMVAVAFGKGIRDMFYDIGVDKVVEGGQTMNPSTDDIFAAVQGVPAEHVFILPNNKNIIMAAEQVAPLTEKKISVLNTKTIPQGITAALNFDSALSSEDNHMAMMTAAEKVGTGSVTFAARDSVIDGQKVKEGEILGMENGRITVIDPSDIEAVAYKIAKRLFRKNLSSLITVYYGEGIDEERAEKLCNTLRSKFGSEADVEAVNGGQPVYYYIISVE